jgi:hypothetical protein
VAFYFALLVGSAIALVASNVLSCWPLPVFRKLQTEQEVAAYLEGLLCSQQRIRQQQQPQAAVGLDAAQGSLASGWFSGSGLTTVQLSVAATPAGTEHTAVNVSHDAGPASGAAAAAAAAAHQHDGLQPPANSTLQRGPSGASVSTSLHGAAGASGTAGAGGTSDGGAADAVSLLPGEVAWFKASGYNHWPCMCITQEEGIHRGLSGESAATCPAGIPVLALPAWLTLRKPLPCCELSLPSLRCPPLRALVAAAGEDVVAAAC